MTKENFQIEGCAGAWRGAHREEIAHYLSREFRMAVRPNHLGMALQRHLRAQLTNAAAR